MPRAPRFPGYHLFESPDSVTIPRPPPVPRFPALSATPRFSSFAALPRYPSSASLPRFSSFTPLPRLPSFPSLFGEVEDMSPTTPMKPRPPQRHVETVRPPVLRRDPRTPAVFYGLSAGVLLGAALAFAGVSFNGAPPETETAPATPVVTTATAARPSGPARARVPSVRADDLPRVVVRAEDLPVVSPGLVRAEDLPVAPPVTARPGAR